MDFTMFRSLVIGSVRAPQQVARVLMALDLPMPVRWTAFGAVIAASAALGTAAEILFSFITKVDLGSVTSPVLMAGVQGALILYGAWAMTFFGRMSGGRGQFADALLLVTWIEAVLILGQLLQLLVMVFFPIISVIGSIALVALLFWLLVQFTAALHGFDNLVKVGAAVIAVFIGSGLFAGALLVALGVVPEPVQL